MEGKNCLCDENQLNNILMKKILLTFNLLSSLE